MFIIEMTKMGNKKQGIFLAVFIFLISLASFFYLIRRGASLVPQPVASTEAQTSVTITPKKILEAKAAEPTQVKYSGFCLNVPVLLYHHIAPAESKTSASITVDPATFDQQMGYLASRGYRTISAEDLANALISHQGLGKAVVVTLDDGYDDAYSYAFPIAKKYNVVLNLMIPTGLVGNPGYLTWDNLREMTGSGLAFAYDHSWSHYALARGDEQKMQYEIMTSKTQLEEQLGRAVKIIAYPYGSYNQKVISTVQNNGFIAAYTTNPSFTQCDSFLFALHRNRIGNSQLSNYGL